MKVTTRGARPLCDVHVGNHRAFTIIELMVVLAIIILLAGIILGVSGYVQNKGARSRAEAEIAAMSAALESYKADNGIYVTNADTTALDPTSDRNASPPPTATNKYSKAGLYLYEQLAGVTSGVRSQAPTSKVYFTFKPTMLYPKDTTRDIVAIMDPFGNLYGYSTSKANGGNGYNPTFDMWSTATDTSGNNSTWVKNW